MSLPLLPGEIESMRRLICPKCSGCAFYYGPRGGESQNILCDGCHREYNVGPAGTVELLADPCMPDRRREVYQVTWPPRPIEPKPKQAKKKQQREFEL